MQDFTLPANIKQIGSIGDGLRIYVEDYVCTFLQQYAEAGEYNERLAFLVGRHIVIDGQEILFVAGALHGKYSEKHEGFLRFSEKSIGYAEDMLDEFFPGMEIVGWMQSQPSYGVYLNQHYAAYHLRQFKKPYHVLFVVDPLERANGFYMANQAALTPADRLAEVSGYFIYYEKNTNMHEYMLANKSLDYTAADPNYIEVTPMEYTAEGDYDSYHEPDYGFEKNEGRFTMMGREPEDVIRRHQANKAKRKGQVSAQKRATNLLGSLSAVLFVVAFVMGVSLIRNQERIERMELEIRQLITAHRNLSQHVASGELAPVFAEVAQQEYPTYIYDTNADTPTPETAIETAILPTAPDEQEAIIPPTPEAYTIQPGDSLIAISIRFFGDAGMVEEILALNGIEDPDLIVAGRTIALPQR